MSSGSQPANNRPGTAGPLPAPHRDAIRWLVRRGIPAGALILTIICLLVRLTVKDAYVWSAVFFYIGPWPVLLAAWPVLLWWHRRSRWKAGLALLGLVVSLTTLFLAPDPSPTPAAVPDVPNRKILFWNIGHPKSIPEKVHELMAAHQPDLVVLAEAEKQSIATLDSFLKRYPGWRILPLAGGLLVAVKGSVNVEDSLALPSRSRAHRLTIRFPTDPEPWHLIAADLGPWPPTPRLTRTDRVRAFAGNNPRTLIVGDFNTPYDSTAFDTWRHTLRHGLTHAPNRPGAATWALGLPLLSIDHVWMSPDLTPTHAAKGTVLPFDHAWQVVSIGTAAP